MEKKELITKDSLFIESEDGQMVVAPTALEIIREIEVTIKSLNKRYKKYKDVLLDGMESYGIEKVDTDAEEQKFRLKAGYGDIAQ